MINEQIRDREVRLIGQDGEQLGIMSAREAQKIAQEAELDLVKIAPTAKPPVCKIIDYGKYKYEQTRKEKLAKKKQKVIDVKEVRMSPNIDTNDLNTKINHAKKFLAKGARVKVTLQFRGRELAHVNASKYILDEFAKALEQADHIVLADIYAAREVDTGEVSSRDVMKLLQEDGQDVHYFPSFEEIKDFVKAHVKGHDLLITMGAGNVVEIGEELLAEK